MAPAPRTAVLGGNRFTPHLTLTFDGRGQVPNGMRFPKYPTIKRFGGKLIHKGRPTKLLDWVKQLPGRRFDPEQTAWIVTDPGPDADRVFHELGFHVDLTKGAKLGVTSLVDLATPLFTKNSANPWMTIVSPDSPVWRTSCPPAASKTPLVQVAGSCTLPICVT